MLGKLLKHEWRAVWKVPVLLIGILMITAVIAGGTFALPIWNSEWVGLPLSGVMLIMTFYFAMIAVSIGIMIYFAVRFYKNVFTDEGYLTNTLPVSARELLINKVITMSAWNLIGGIAIVLSIVVFVIIMILSLMPKTSSFARDLFREMAHIPELFDSPYMEGFQGFCASLLIMVLVGAFNSTMMVIGSITLGQQVRGHRVLGAVGAYFAISAVVQVINTVVMMPMMFTMFENARMDSPFPILTIFYLISSAISLLIAVGLYFLCEYLIGKRLELE